MRKVITYGEHVFGLFIVEQGCLSLFRFSLSLNTFEEKLSGEKDYYVRRRWVKFNS